MFCIYYEFTNAIYHVVPQEEGEVSDKVHFNEVFPFMEERKKGAKKNIRIFFSRLRAHLFYFALKGQ